MRLRLGSHTYAVHRYGKEISLPARRGEDVRTLLSDLVADVCTRGAAAYEKDTLNRSMASLVRPIAS